MMMLLMIMFDDNDTTDSDGGSDFDGKGKESYVPYPRRHARFFGPGRTRPPESGPTDPAARLPP